jgi:purine-nucleoside phosphorylase
MDWSKARVFDFTARKDHPPEYSKFGAPVIEVLRGPEPQKLAIILDTGFGWHAKAPAVVRDHINLSGENPLIGPNHPIGPRFPVMQGLYVSDVAAALQVDTAIVAALSQGRTLDAEDADFIRVLDADCYCFNIVPTALVASHAGWKVLAIVGPDNRSWQRQVLEKIQNLTVAV